MASRMLGQQIVPVDLNHFMWNQDTLELTKQNINAHYSESILQFFARFDECEGLEQRVRERYTVAFVEFHEFELECLDDILRARCLPLCSESATTLLREVDAEENAEEKRARQLKACGHVVDGVIQAWRGVPLFRSRVTKRGRLPEEIRYSFVSNQKLDLMSLRGGLVRQRRQQPDMRETY